MTGNSGNQAAGIARMAARFFGVLCLACAAQAAETPCSLVTPADAGQVLGLTITAGVPSKSHVRNSCRFGAPWPWEHGYRAVTGFPKVTLGIDLGEEHARENF